MTRILTSKGYIEAEEWEIKLLTYATNQMRWRVEQIEDWAAAIHFTDAIADKPAAAARVESLIRLGADAFTISLVSHGHLEKLG